MAAQFVLVRLGNIDRLDLSLFDFDFDLTFAVFLMKADGRVYARYGQRNARGPDALQSLKGLEYAMQSALEMHRRDGLAQKFAPRTRERSVNISEIGGRTRRCYHCHDVREALNRELVQSGKWERERAYRYPPTENVGLSLEVDQGNVVAKVQDGSPAGRVGLKKGDVLRSLNGVPVHSIADALYGLELAPGSGTAEVAWARGPETMSGKLVLRPGWRKSDLRWRPSMWHMLPSLSVQGTDLTAAEKTTLGLKPDQLAIRQRAPVGEVKAAGVRAGDILVGIDKELVELDGEGLAEFIFREYLVGDRVQLIVLRDGKRLTLPLVLSR
jgi:hypothetical protein